MSGHNGAHHAADDEAMRLEAALDRIARAAAQARQAAHQARETAAQASNAAAEAQHTAAAAHTGLHDAEPHATTATDTAEVAARIDALIASIRGVLGTQSI